MSRTPPLILAVLSLTAQPGFAVEIIDPGQGAVLLPAGGEAATELSDIAYRTEDGSYLLVSDDTSGGARVFSATITLDPVTGAIVGTPSIDTSLTLAAGADTEGLAISSPGRFFVSDEVGPAIREHDATGAVVQALAVPEPFTSGVRANLGFEALSDEPLAIPRNRAVAGGQGLWAANEEALVGDGPVSSFTSGTIVRIQRFDDGLQPAGQWGYVTDPIQGDILGSGAGRDVEVSGVVELAVLPDGTVLALERALGGTPFPQFRSRIYALGFDGADDTTDEPTLAMGAFAPVTKSLLWEATFNFGGGLPNYEGMALGPTLDDGDLSLILVSDDNGGSSEQSLYALRVSGILVPVPPTVPNVARPLRVARNPSRASVEFHVDPTAGDVVEVFGPSGALLDVVVPDGRGRARWAPAAAPGVYWARVRGAPEWALPFLLLK